MRNELGHKYRKPNKWGFGKSGSVFLISCPEVGHPGRALTLSKATLMYSWRGYVIISGLMSIGQPAGMAGLTFSIYDLAFYLEILLFSSDFSHLISENCVMCCKGAWQSVLLCFTAPAVETALKMEVWGERAFRVCHSLGIQHITQIFTAEILEDLWRSIIKAKG